LIPQTFGSNPGDAAMHEKEYPDECHRSHATRFSDDAVHEYPSMYPPGSHWAITEAWKILDSLKPGVLDINQRSLLAGMITGVLMKAKGE
jgi:hypothetical protein